MDQWLIESVLQCHPEISKIINYQWTRAEAEWYIDWVQMENVIRRMIISVEAEAMTPTDMVILTQEVIRTFTRRESTSDNNNKTN